MTDREKAIVSAYTGVAMLVGNKLNIFYEYIAKICGRPIYTSELANPIIQDEIKEKSKPDFIELCKSDEDTEKNEIAWQYCRDLNDINDALSVGGGEDWEGLKSPDQIISITYDTNHRCYVVFWKV